MHRDQYLVQIFAYLNLYLAKPIGLTFILCTLLEQEQLSGKAILDTETLSIIYRNFPMSFSDGDKPWSQLHISDLLRKNRAIRNSELWSVAVLHRAEGGG